MMMYYARISDESKVKTLRQAKLRDVLKNITSE
jgi:hypothetical protein